MRGFLVDQEFYDGGGRLVAEEDGDGNITTTLYDKAGNVTGTLDARASWSIRSSTTVPVR